MIYMVAWIVLYGVFGLWMGFYLAHFWLVRGRI